MPQRTLKGDLMTLTLKDHFKLVDTTIKHNIGGLTVDVRVLDVKQSWGQVKYQITPISGSGAVWIVAPGEK